MAPNRKNSADAQKGKTGRNVTREGIGSSMSTESNAMGSNSEISEGNNRPFEGRQSRTTGKPQPASSAGHSSRNGGAAPTYVNNQVMMDKGGPHGKNLKEDKGLQGENASFTEFGTRADPGRLAEQKFTSETMPGNTGGGGRENRLNKKSQFDALGGDASA